MRVAVFSGMVGNTATMTGVAVMARWPTLLPVTSACLTVSLSALVAVDISSLIRSQQATERGDHLERISRGGNRS
jgi:hypothetical protein